MTANRFMSPQWLERWQTHTCLLAAEEKQRRWGRAGLLLLLFILDSFLWDCFSFFFLLALYCVRDYTYHHHSLSLFFCRGTIILTAFTQKYSLSWRDCPPGPRNDFVFLLFSLSPNGFSSIITTRVVRWLAECQIKHQLGHTGSTHGNKLSVSDNLRRHDFKETFMHHQSW